MSNLPEYIKSVNELPMILPDMNKKELFNAVQESEPIAQLAGKKFKMLGIIPENVEVPKYNEKDLKEGKVALESDDIGNEMVERLRITLVTNIGVFHSFSFTFNKALAKVINVFGADYIKEEYVITAKIRGSGNDAKAYYVLKAV